MSAYTDRLLPRILDRALGTAEAARFRAMATAGLTGTVVEIGFGSGLNVAHYPAAVDRVYAVEPSPGARRLARHRIEEAAVLVELIGLDGQHLPLDDGVADAVLTTWTLCTIPDLARALAEVRRVLRPGGRLHFLEHGRHPDPKVRAWQRRFNPIQRRLMGGCHLDRPIDTCIADAGLAISTLDHHQLSGPRAFGYLYQGAATREDPGRAGAP
jgi:SAM-dependent methyltransferase